MSKEYIDQPFSAFKFIVTSVEFYLELASIAVVSFILPASFLYGFIAKAFFYGTDAADFPVKAYTLLIMLPLLFIIDLFSWVGLVQKWYQNSKKYSGSASEKKSKVPPIIKSICTVAIVYCCVSMGIPWFLPLLITLWNIGGGFGFIWILAFVIGAITLVVIVFYVRAVFKRKDFITKLKRYCKTNSVYISDIKNPYLSIFVSKRACDFSIEKDGKRYDCKFIAGVFPDSPIVFSDKGNGIRQNTIRFFKVEAFHILTKLDFSYESENKKILIVSPTPKNIYSSANGSQPRLADTGEKVGEYTIYNSTGFMGALDRNCL